MKQKQIAVLIGESESYVTRRMKVIEDAMEYDMLDDGERTETQIKAEIEYRKMPNPVVLTLKCRFYIIIYVGLKYEGFWTTVEDAS